MDGREQAQGLRPKAQEAQEAQEALGDSRLDRELATALGIEVSPEFLARVRTRIAADPAPAVEFGFSWIRRHSFEPLAGVAIAGMVLAVVVPQFMRDETARPKADVARVASVAPPTVEAVAERRPVTTPARQRTVAAPRMETPRTLPLQLSPVLFAEEDQRAFALFVTAVGEGRMPEEVVRRSGEPRAEATLSIEPLVIDPLPLLAGVRKEGEGQW